MEYSEDGVYTVYDILFCIFSLSIALKVLKFQRKMSKRKLTENDETQLTAKIQR